MRPVTFRGITHIREATRVPHTLGNIRHTPAKILRTLRARAAKNAENGRMFWQNPLRLLAKDLLV
jgi:hypothetical protein